MKFHRTAIALVSLIIIQLIFFLAVIVGERQRRLEVALLTASNMATVTASATEDFFGRYLSIFNALKSIDHITRQEKIPSNKILQRLNNKYPEIVNFAAVKQDGYFFASGKPMPEGDLPNIKHLGFFQQIFSGQKRVIMQPHPGPISKQIVTGIVVPLEDGKGKINGLIGVSIKFSALINRWENIFRDSNIMLIVHDGKGVGHFVSPGLKTVENDFLNTALSNNFQTIQLDKTIYVLFTTIYPDSGWKFTVFVPAHSNLINLLTSRKDLIFLFLLMIITINILGIWFYQQRQWALTLTREQKKLQQSEERFRSVAETAVDAIISIDSHGKIFFWNKAAQFHFGYSKDELLGKSVSLIVPDKFKKAHQDGLKRMLTAKTPKIIGKTVEVLGLKKDNTQFPIELSLAMWKANGVLFFTAIIRDISNRKRIENALKENEQKYRSIFENSPVAIVHFDKFGVITACNQNFCEILGSSQNKIIGLNTMKSLKNEMMINSISKALSGHKSYYEGEYLSVIKGAPTPVRAIYAPIISEDREVTGAMGILENITEQLSAEQEKTELESQLRQLQKVEAIGALAGGIAHDFNNILFPILGYAEILVDDLPEDSPYLESINEILIGAKRAKGLVEQILTFSRQADHNVSPLKPGLIIKEVIKLIRSTIPATIKIEQYIDPHCLMILADATQIHQVAMNLITNAYQAMQNSGGTLTIKLQNIADMDQIDEKSKDSEKAFVWLSVSDTGDGMNSITLEKIFDPYFTTKPKGEGTGLGLSVIHGIIKNYGGQIIVKSTPGEGSTFDVYIPAIQQKTIFESKIENFINTKGNENILLVDDEHQILRLEKMILERSGYKVEIQDKSMRAFELVKADPDKFDLMVTDMTMPDMTGDVLAQKVMDIIPNFPVIVCTGFSDRISPEKAVSIGIKGLLYKPIIKSEFIKMVRSVLDKEKLC
ncbi:MAG: PAS domain S-box protein [Desulfobacula sp.]|nr:PAS domain S-box protein [Desulfobacula sp.]